MDYHHLELGNASSLVQAIRLTNWGKSVVVDCLYDPLGERKPYQLSFQGCSQVQIDTLPGAPSDEPEADLLGIHLGQDGCRQPAILTTDLFELHIAYEHFQCIQTGLPNKVSAESRR